MRGGFAPVLVVVTALGCSARQYQVEPDTRASLPSRAYVSVPRLADDLALAYRGDAGGYIELSAPPDNIVLVEDSRRALVNGRAVSMECPCQLRGAEYVVASTDAERVTRVLEQFRSGRRPPPTVDRRPPPPAPTVLRAAWRPNAVSRPWKYIVIHHMASDRGSAAAIHRIHKSKDFDGLGYHFVIGNGTLSGDGAVEVGYRWKNQIHGAHARVQQGDDNFWNRFGIGICLVGDFTAGEPSDRQMASLVELVRQLRATYGIPAKNVVPHRFVKPTQCPGANFPWPEFHVRIH